MSQKKKAFTMIELMIVIAIVAILSSVIPPMLRGRSQRAKWSEAMAGCSAIATSIRSWAAENSHEGSNVSPSTTLTDYGFVGGDLQGKYFIDGDYSISSCSVQWNDGQMVLEYVITVNGDTDSTTAKPEGTLSLDQNGTFTLTQNAGSTSVF